MFRFFILSCSVLLFSKCSNSTNETKRLSDKVDSLEKKLTASYHPGLGEFMSELQLHHGKLFFAGKNVQWELAQFELDEIKETQFNARKYCKDRPEVNKLGMIDPALEAIQEAVKKKDSSGFKNAYSMLTAGCNNCHSAVNFSFNEIIEPIAPPVTNQRFAH